MTEQPYERTMKKAAQILGFSLYVRGWTIKEIAKEVDYSPNSITTWKRDYGWKLRRDLELRDIEQEMRDKVMDAREKIINIADRTLDDVFIKDSNGNIVGVAIQIERVADLKGVTELILKAGGVPDKVESKVEKTVDVDVTGEVKVEVVSPEMAAEIGRLIAIKESEAVDDV